MRLKVALNILIIYGCNALIENNCTGQLW